MKFREWCWLRFFSVKNYVSRNVVFSSKVLKKDFRLQEKPLAQRDLQNMKYFSFSFDGNQCGRLEPDLNICYFLSVCCYSKPYDSIIFYFYFFCKYFRRVTSASRSILRATSASSPSGLVEHPPQSQRFALHGHSHEIIINPHNLESVQLTSTVSTRTYPGTFSHLVFQLAKLGACATSAL